MSNPGSDLINIKAYPAIFNHQFQGIPVLKKTKMDNVRSAVFGSIIQGLLQNTVNNGFKAWREVGFLNVYFFFNKDETL